MLSVVVSFLLLAAITANKYEYKYYLAICVLRDMIFMI